MLVSYYYPTFYDGNDHIISYHENGGFATGDTIQARFLGNTNSNMLYFAIGHSLGFSQCSA